MKIGQYLLILFTFTVLFKLKNSCLSDKGAKDALVFLTLQSNNDTLNTCRIQRFSY